MIASPVRRAVGLIEPLTSFTYFAPEAKEEYEAIGIDQAVGYFVGRSAPLGRATPAAVASTFFGFSPAVVEMMLRWDRTDPETVLAARDRIIERAGTRLLAEDDGTLPDLARATEIIRAAIPACRPEGRALFAAHLALPWPEHPVVSFWHGLNLLREFRGDGHIAVLLTHDVDAVEAIILHTGFTKVDQKFHRNTRGWGDEAFDAATARLIERGFLDPDGTLNDAGAKFREMIEMETDHLAAPPYAAMGEAAEELLDLLKPLAERVIERRGSSRRATGIAMAGGAPS